MYNGGMARLIQLPNGNWINLDSVTRLEYLWQEVLGSGVLPPRVAIKGEQWTVEVWYKTEEEAKAFRDGLAAKVNGEGT